jgi:hypothetical protein
MKMRNFLFLLAGFSSLTFAQTPPMSSNANQFAEQSGAIAGTAQACGQDVSTLSTRTAEVINVLTKIPAEQQEAMMIYEKVLASSQINQTRNHPMNCSQVLQSYNGLPLLKSDYKQTILPAMAKMGAPQ